MAFFFETDIYRILKKMYRCSPIQFHIRSNAGITAGNRDLVNQSKARIALSDEVENVINGIYLWACNLSEIRSHNRGNLSSCVCNCDDLSCLHIFLCSGYIQTFIYSVALSQSKFILRAPFVHGQLPVILIAYLKFKVILKGNEIHAV